MAFCSVLSQPSRETDFAKRITSYPIHAHRDQQTDTNMAETLTKVINLIKCDETTGDCYLEQLEQCKAIDIH